MRPSVNPYTEGRRAAVRGGGSTMTDPANTAGKQRGSPFPKGRSGNPAGKPKGARHRSTIAIEILLEGEAEAIGRKCVAMALEGDTTALRLAMERIAPVRRGRPVKFKMPDGGTASDVVTAIGAVLQAVATGELTCDEAATLSTVLEAKRRSIELVEIEQRISALEQQSAGR
jgi:hypothetical protein